MRTYKLIGNITTIQPVNITLPNTKGMPLSQGLPMIPASSIRGWLRHACHDGITELFFANGKTLDVDLHYLIASGVDTSRSLSQSGQSTKVGLSHATRLAHPVLSTWGYWGLAGLASVGSAVASNKDALLVLNGGARQHVFNRNDKLSGFIDESQLGYLQDILQADKYSAEAMADYKLQLKELKSSIGKTSDADEKAEIKEKIKDVELLIREVKDNRIGASESIQRPLEMIEAIDQGQTLPNRMILKNPNEHELDILLWSIAMGSLKPFIGGHSNANFGEVSAEWELSVTDIQNLTPKKLGKIGFNEDGFYSDIEGFDANEVSKKIIDGTINIASFDE
ncbi:MAG: hypothetical protein VYA60_04845 [Pseudomonadota bacterium]|nr:hypothetical protein [Pseudomonadota bacterium]